jgi:hypothetical protein
MPKKRMLAAGGQQEIRNGMAAPSGGRFLDNWPDTKKSHVRAGCLQPFVEDSVVGGELAAALFESDVLGGDALDGFVGPLEFEVANLTEEFADVLALNARADSDAGDVVHQDQRPHVCDSALVVYQPVACQRPVYPTP